MYKSQEFGELLFHKNTVLLSAIFKNFIEDLDVGEFRRMNNGWRIKACRYYKLVTENPWHLSDVLGDIARAIGAVDLIIQSQDPSTSLPELICQLANRSRIGKQTYVPQPNLEKVTKTFEGIYVDSEATGLILFELAKIFDDGHTAVEIAYKRVIETGVGNIRVTGHIGTVERAASISFNESFSSLRAFVTAADRSGAAAVEDGSQEVVSIIESIIGNADKSLSFKKLILEKVGRFFLEQAK